MLRQVYYSHLPAVKISALFNASRIFHVVLQDSLIHGFSLSHLSEVNLVAYCLIDPAAVDSAVELCLKLVDKPETFQPLIFFHGDCTTV